ncbi:hypothetical protein ASD65_10795 [Microbacterium sp. Root61]|uniref:hypothetical protein n=1 Tax=Microbacterium sp. Root61 TaxID=1736570 RepID=UPI0007000562|nr:hypothetical protein [Microbacterium sp. Root61]KRA24858.1 hypothetical protein ASD65_10795 [Microbacterium sp. Root61]
MDAEVLTARLRTLEAQNAALVREVERDQPHGGWWRSVASALVITIAAILVPVSIAGAWARVQLVEEEAFVSTLSPVVDDPAVQALIIDETMSAVRAQVDFAAVTDALFDGIAELGVGARANDALDLLRQPAAGGLENLVATGVTTVVESDAFSEVWTMVLRGAHRALTLASTSDGGGIVVLSSEGLGIALGPLVENIKDSLSERGVGVAFLIPTVDNVIIIGSGESLIAIRTGYAIADAIGWWLPVIALALFALGIALARRRSAAVLGAGLGVTLGAASLGALLSLGSFAVAMVAAELALSPSALAVIYAQLVEDMQQTAWIFALLGLAVAAIGWFMGRSRAARRTRMTLDSLNASARRSLVERGLQTGGFGEWLGRHRVAVRVIVAMLGVTWLFALRPLSGGDIVLVIVVALMVGWMLELLQRRPDEIEVFDDLSGETADAQAIAKVS